MGKVASGREVQSVQSKRQANWFVEFTEDFIEKDRRTKSHVGFVLEGELEIDFGGERVNYTSGQGIFILEGENNVHKARAVAPLVKVILVEDL
jgi:ethanolamine utilization protein EutQ (cupin superfamily)